MGVENILKYGVELAELPLPATGEFSSAQCAAYWDGTYIHVWYGCHTAAAPDEDEEDIYYTKAASPFTSWDAAVLVIQGSGVGGGVGFRDPTLVVESSDLYFFLQTHTGSHYDEIYLYKIAKADDFADSADYTQVGKALEHGAAGEFDEVWCASPLCRKIGSTYYLLYEAKDAVGEYSVGLASSSAIETIPYTKIDQVKDVDDNVIRNPYGSVYDFVPDCFFDDDTVVFHGGTPLAPPETEIWYMKGDWTTGTVKVQDENAEFSVQDEYDSHNDVSFIQDSSGDIATISAGTVFFLGQTWDYGDDSSKGLRIFSLDDMQDGVLIDGQEVNIQRWGEEMIVLESVSDEWENKKCVRKTEVHGAVRVFTLDLYEKDVEWMDSVVQRLQARATLGTTVWLSSDKTIRQILREVVILEAGFVGEPGEPGEYREYTVKMREAF